MIDEEGLARSIRSMKARRSKVLGNAGELVVRARLIQRGLRCVERIQTGYRRIGDRWVPCERVSGDWRAVAPGGRSVLVEVKLRNAERLVFDVLERHQVQALDQHHEAGGLSLLAWIHRGGVALMEWPCVGFRRGASLTVAEAMAMEWRP